MVSTFTPNLALEVPARGDYPNTWDIPMDPTLNTIDAASGGITTVTVTGGNTVINLTQDQANNAFLNVTGTIANGWTIITYPPIGGRRWVIPGCQGMSPDSGNYLYVRGNNGTDQNGVYFWQTVGLPHGIIVAPWRVWWDYGGGSPGEIKSFGSGWIPNGHLPLDGRQVDATQHDILFDIYGYTYGGSGTAFGLPDLRGRVPVGADNMGTVMGVAGNLGAWAGWGISGYLGEAQHILSEAELAVHTHGVNDPAHIHSVGGHTHPTSGVGPAGVGLQVGAGAGDVSSATGIGYETIQPGVTNISLVTAGSNAAHNNIQPGLTTLQCVRW